MANTNPVLRALRRFGASNAELESAARQKVVESTGASLIGDLQRPPVGEAARHHHRAHHEAPQRDAVAGGRVQRRLRHGHADLDGASLDPRHHRGRELTVSGRVSYVDGQRRLYNPLYELVAG